MNQKMSFADEYAQVATEGFKRPRKQAGMPGWAVQDLAVAAKYGRK